MQAKERVIKLFKKVSIFIYLTVILFLFSGCGKLKIDNSSISGTQNGSKSEDSSSQPDLSNQNPVDNQSNSASNQDGKSNSSNNDKNTNVDKVMDQVKAMSLDEKIGQMVISGVDGYTNDEHSSDLINKYHVGGFIILGQNVKNTSQLLSLMNSLKQTDLKSGNKIPLFLGVDQEGGRIDRMPTDFEKFPTNKAIGQINSTVFSNSVGKALGQEVKAFGFNLDFAPVLDVNSNPKNPVIGDRAFGSNPQIVAKLGVETMIGIRSEKVIPVVKHFPGHGDTSVDSHTGLPIVNNDLKRLKSFELIPFSDAIKNNADMVMVAHILFPKIDSKYPATMSRTIITDILRNNLKYDGVVITDDMTMGAIANNYNIGEAAVRSINAGSDIILVCHDFNKEVQVINALKAAVQNGSLSEETVNKSVYRILKLKQKYAISDKGVQNVDVKNINNLIVKTLNKH